MTTASLDCLLRILSLADSFFLEGLRVEEVVLVDFRTQKPPESGTSERREEVSPEPLDSKTVEKTGQNTISPGLARERPTEAFSSAVASVA